MMDQISNPKISFWLRWLLAGGLLLAATLGQSLMAQDDEIVVIVSSDVNILSLTPNGLRYIYSLRLRNWPDGSRIRVYALPDDNETHGEFCRHVLGTYPASLRLAWDRVAYTGIASPAIQVATEEAMVAAIASSPQAIGYVHRKAVTPGVKILPITRER